MDLTCKYCKVFLDGEKVNRNSKQFRKCFKIKKLVTYKKEICEYFIPSDIFFCESSGKVLKSAKCLEKKKKPKSLQDLHCRNCSQYVDVMKLRDFGKETKSLKRRKLRRRK